MLNLQADIKFRITGLSILILQLSFLVSNAQWAQKGSDIDGDAAGDFFGEFVAISGDGSTVIIGTEQVAYARVYEWSGAAWIQKGADLDESPHDCFGESVSISEDGDIIAIGGNCFGPGFNTGLVKVYEWNGASWIQKGQNIDGTDPGGGFGRDGLDITSDGTVIAIGAQDQGRGRVVIYEWSAGSWVQKGAALDGEVSFGSSFGCSVSLSSNGDIIAIGDQFNNETGNAVGHVRIFEWNGAAWVQKGIDIDGEAVDDYSGFSVSISDDGLTVAIGALGNDGTATDAGHARVYEWNGAAWVQKGIDIDGEAAHDASGQSVSISSDGNTVAIGARENDGTDTNAGHARVYNWTGGAWVQVGADIDGEAKNDQSAKEISLSSDGLTIAIGAKDNDGNGNGAGHVRIYSHVPLPIELTKFHAKWNDENYTEVLLEWQTETEIDNEYFYIERSTDAIHFEDVARINGAVNSTSAKDYSYIDDALPSSENPQGMFFYRLRQQDFDGTITYSNIETLNIEEGIGFISLYPNPTFGNFDYVVSSTVDSKIRVSISDYTGRFVKEEISEIGMGINTMEMNVEELGSGNYLFIIETEDGLYNASRRFVTQKK